MLDKVTLTEDEIATALEATRLDKLRRESDREFARRFLSGEEDTASLARRFECPDFFVRASTYSAVRARQEIPLFRGAGPDRAVIMRGAKELHRGRYKRGEFALALAQRYLRRIGFTCFDHEASCKFLRGLQSRIEEKVPGQWWDNRIDSLRLGPGDMWLRGTLLREVPPDRRAMLERLHNLTSQIEKAEAA